MVPELCDVPWMSSLTTSGGVAGLPLRGGCQNDPSPSILEIIYIYIYIYIYQFSSVQFSHSVMSDSL